MAQQEASFAERLATLMEKKDVTQEQLGKRIGVGQSAIANLLNRNCRPQRKTVVRIADALGIAPQELWPQIKLD
jgi:transcriptional regulator with XRE-family HTH domain